jgi:hypothetical protein
MKYLLLPLALSSILGLIVTDAFTLGAPRRFFAGGRVASPPLVVQSAAFVATLQATPPGEGDDEYFNFEPADDELAQLGEELVELEGEVEDVLSEKVVVEDDVPAVPEPPVPGFTNGAAVFDDDEAVMEDEEDDDEVDIPFDGDEEEEVISEEVVAEGDEFAYEDEEDEEYEYYEEEEEAPDEWDDFGMGGDTETDDVDYELQDDDDPNYMVQKERVEKNMAKLDEEDQEMAEREGLWEDVTTAMTADEENFEDFSFIANFNEEAVSTGEDEPELEWSDGVADKVKKLMESNNFMTINDADVEEMANSFNENRGPDDPQDPLEAADEEIDEELRKAEYQRLTQGADIDDLQNLVATKYDGDQKKSTFIDVNQVAEIGMEGVEAFRDIPDNLIGEIKDCMTEMGSASYNVTKWLVYDLDFNVTNLMLAACQHNPKAPIIFEHWFPQLQVCERYQYARDGNFSFTWADSSDADMDELYRYYRGFGYNEIPEKAPRDTGIINLEELDEDEVQMADFAAWCQEVYNPEWDRKDFDDDDIKDVDNVFSPQFVMPQHPDVPAYADAKEDIRNWYGEIDAQTDGDVSPEQAEYRDMVGQELDYKYIDDKEFTDAFRGHLIVACTTEEEDLDVAEKITIRFEEEFGKQVFVETRVISHALLEDNVFEVWLESYEIELLHSKKRATTGAKDWIGPIYCDEAEIEKLVERVAFLISDDSRYSYRLDMGAILS